MGDMSGGISGFWKPHTPKMEENRMALSDLTVRNAKPGTKTALLAEEEGETV